MIRVMDRLRPWLLVFGLVAWTITLAFHLSVVFGWGRSFAWAMFGYSLGGLLFYEGRQ